MYEKIKFEISDGIALICINNPKQMNTLFPKSFKELNMAVDAIEEDSSVRAVIIHGNEKLFCAGDNITDEEAQKEIEEKGNIEFVKNLQKTFTRIDKLKQPVIAAVAGYALGGGCELALACDFIIASENTKIGLPEAKLGVIPCIGGTQRLPRRVGSAWAKEIMFTCDFLSAEEACRIGLVNHVVPEGEVLNKAMKIAKKICERAPISLSMINNAVDLGMDTDLLTGLEIEARNTDTCLRSEDINEGLTAFAEKRKPVFKNR